MFTYLSDVALLVVMCSVPFLVSSLRLGNNRSRKSMYDLAKDIPGKLFFGHSIVVGAATPTLPRLRFRHRGTTACENSNESGARGRERAWPYGINRQTSRGSRPCGEGLAHNLQHTPSVQLLWHVVRGQDRFCELPGCLIQPTEPFLRPKNGRNLSKCGQCVDCRTPSQASAELRKAILNP